MPALDLRPNETVSSDWSLFGTGPTQHEAIDEDVSSTDVTNGVETATSGGVALFGLTTVTDFGSLTSVRAVVVAKNQTAWSDDTHTLAVRLVKSDGTILQTNNFSVTSDSSWTTFFGTSVTGSAIASQAELDGLRVELTFTRGASGMNDGAGVMVAALEAQLDYTAAAAAPTPRRTLLGVGT